MSTLFLGIIAFVLVAWFIRSSKSSDIEVKKPKKEIPSYEDLVKMPSEEFNKWLFVFSAFDYRDTLLSEMVAFEETNGILAKEIERTGRQPKEGTLLVHNVFNAEKSSKAVELLTALGKETNKDLVLDALLAKVATGRVFKP